MPMAERPRFRVGRPPFEQARQELAEGYCFAYVSTRCLPEL